MACSKVVMIAVQMGVLAAIGMGLGILDSKRRPVMVNAPEIAPPLPASGSATQGAATNSASPSETPPDDANASETAPVTASAPDAAAQPVATATGAEQIDPDLVKQGHITVAQAAELFNGNPPAYFIDARRKDQYEAGHVRDAFRLPLDAFKGREPAHMAVMPREDVYVVYCDGGNCDESVAVQKQLLLAAYTKVYVMHAGYPGWVAAGHPTQTGEDPIEAAEGRP